MPAFCQVGKGNQILLNRGLQVQGMVTSGDVFHLNTYSNANYTSINWLWDSNPSAMGAAPGFPWTRWVGDETNMPGMPGRTGETPYIPQLVTLQLGDEWNLNDDGTRTRAVNWFNSVRSAWTNTILYMNNYGGQVGDTQLGDFITRAQPDMLSFDSYPWQSVWDVNAPNHTGPPIGGPPTGWYGDLRRYRQWAFNTSLPLATYMQTFHSVQDYDHHVFRDPSPSELRLNHFAALAFNAKVLIDFTYNTGASSLFTNPGGDTYPTSLLSEKTDAALRARNFGKALVRLKPINDATAQYTTSIMFIRGRDPNGTPNPLPNSFVADADSPNAYTDWVFQRNDPYLTGWTVLNQGTRNNGQIGDVIISWFKPLDESFDGTGYTNELYLMVVNGLTWTNGTAADCQQEIQLNFVDTFTAVELLNPLTGDVQAQVLPVVNSRRQLVLDLNGGDAALFKFYDGAPFVGAQVTGQPAITSQPQGRTVNAGSNVLFTVTATGTPAPGYQWRFNGANISGATASSYTRMNAQSADAGSYSVVVSNVLASVVSTNAVLVVNGRPSITAQPQSQAALAGGSVAFNVTATGAGTLSYQWRKDGSNLSNGARIAGATSSALMLSNLQAADLGDYAVVVTNSYGAVTSAPATLSFATVPTIQAQPQSITNEVRTTATFTVMASGNGLAYRWQRGGTNLFDGGNLAGTTTDTLILSSVTGSDAANYTVVITNAAGSVTSAPAALTVVYALPFQEPFGYAAGANLGGQTSPDLLSWADVGTGTAGPYITTQSGNLDVPGLAPATGNSILFGGLGKSARLSFPSPFTTGTVYYSFALTVLDLTGASTAGGFLAGFNNSTGTQANQPTVVGTRVYLATTNGGFMLGVAKNSSTASDWAWAASVFNTNQTIFLVGSYTFTTAGNSTDDVSKLWINPNAVDFGAPNPPAPTLTATSGADVTANQVASFVFFQRSSTVEPAAMVADELRVGTSWADVTPVPAPSIVSQPLSRTNNPGTTASFSVTATGNYPAYAWRRNGLALTDGKNISGSASPTLTLSGVLQADAGTYTVLVSSGGGAVLSAPAVLTVNAPPEISAQPQSQAVSFGTTASFSVTSTGTAPLHYQWRFDGTNISGATNSTYNRDAVQRTDAGSYSVLLTNVAGSLPSSNALLTVNPVAPVRMNSISLLPDGRIHLQGSGDPGYFTILASTNLLDWSPLTNVLGTSGTFDYVGATAVLSQCYYRVRLAP